MSRKAARAAPKLNILLGPDETSIQDSSVDDHYLYRVAGGGGGNRTYNESTLTDPASTIADRGGRSLSGVVHHGGSSSTATSRCRLPLRADGGPYSVDCPGRVSCVEMRTCGCSLLPCPPPPPPAVSAGVTVTHRSQDPIAGGLYTAGRSPVVDQRLRPSVYWQVHEPAPPAAACRPQQQQQQSFDKPPRRTAAVNLAADRRPIYAGGSDDVITGNPALVAADTCGREPDAVSNKPDKSPDLVLNGTRRRDQNPTGSGNASACTSGQDDRQRSGSAVQKRFSNQQTFDGK